MIAGRNSLGVWPALMLTICERGTMMSRTCRSATWIAPSTMARASLSSSLFWWASRSSARSSWRFFGSWAKAWGIFPSQDFCPLLDRSSLMRVYSVSLARWWSFVVGVGVGMTQLGEQLLFQAFHFEGFGFVHMVIAEQVQAAVDDQMSPVGVQGLALFGRFAGDHCDADHQVAEQRDIQQFIWHIGRKGQHVGRIVLVPVGAVQFAGFRFVDQAN